MKNPDKVRAGWLGGLGCSPEKLAAVRENGKFGGRPVKYPYHPENRKTPQERAAAKLERRRLARIARRGLVSAPVKKPKQTCPKCGETYLHVTRMPDHDMYVHAERRQKGFPGFGYFTSVDKSCVVMKPKQPEPKSQDLLKRFRAAKRITKFYTGMMDELLHGVDGDYYRLLGLYETPLYPWTPPTPNYRLPPTEREFQMEYERATDEFSRLLAEGEAAGVLTTSRR